MHLNRDFVWMAPLALMSVTLLAVAPFVFSVAFGIRT